MAYNEQYGRYVGMVEETLQALLPEGGAVGPKDGEIPEHLRASMRYSLLAGGKRVPPGAAAGGLRNAGWEPGGGARPGGGP